MPSYFLHSSLHQTIDAVMLLLTYSLTHSLTYSLTHSLTYSLTHSLTSLLPYSLTHSLTHLLTYLCPSLPVEHRPSTTPRHRTLFWAALVIPDQLVPCCFSSASMSRLQLLRGRPLFLFPCGFQGPGSRRVSKLCSYRHE